MKKINTLVFFFLLFTSAIAQNEAVVPEAAAQDDKVRLEFKFGKGLRFYAPNDNFYFKFEARIQALFQGDYDLAGGKGAFDALFSIRRARLKFSGDLLKKRIEYKMELGLSNRDIQVTGGGSDYANIILDAYIRFKLVGGLKLRVGQFKLPGNRERVISSGSLQMVDRSIVNGAFNLDRDAGIMLENSNNLGNVVIREQASFTMGEGRNRMFASTGFMYAARLEILPMGEFKNKGEIVMAAIDREEKPKLALGVTGSYNDDALFSGGQLGGQLFAPIDIVTLNADLMFKYQGISVYGEYGWRWADNPVSINDLGAVVGQVYKGQGANIQAGYMFKGDWEIAARYAILLPNKAIGLYTDNRSDYTIGASKYIVGHNMKIQADVTYSDRQPIVASRSAAQKLEFRLTTNLNF